MERRAARARDLAGQAALIGVLDPPRQRDRRFRLGRRARAQDRAAGLPGSYEALFHDAGVPAFSLALRDDAELRRALAAALLQRAIGVIYRRAPSARATISARRCRASSMR
jgi:predicted aconitase